MHRFWTRFILPLLMAASPGRVLEIGAEFGWNTARLLALGRKRNFFLEIIDPSPHPVFHDAIDGFAGAYAFHEARSLDVIASIPATDFVLLDGDHNWYTVYNELSRLFAKAASDGRAPPIILFHDLAWPYARRDMYYDANSIPELERQPFARRGMIPGEPGLVEAGANAAFANALREGGPRNGVLTAVEDFIEASGIDALFRRLPFFNGLGILIPAARLTEALQETVDGFFTPESLTATVEELETEINKLRVELAVSQQHLTRSTDALVRARRTISEMYVPDAPRQEAPSQEGLPEVLPRDEDFRTLGGPGRRLANIPVMAKQILARFLGRVAPRLTRAEAPGPLGRN